MIAVMAGLFCSNNGVVSVFAAPDAKIIALEPRRGHLSAKAGSSKYFGSANDHATAPAPAG
jgi:hypothetical protein